MGVTAHSRGWHRKRIWRVREGALTKVAVPKCRSPSVSVNGSLLTGSDMSSVRDAHLAQVDKVKVKVEANASVESQSSLVQVENLNLYAPTVSSDSSIVINKPLPCDAVAQVDNMFKSLHGCDVALAQVDNCYIRNSATVCDVAQIADDSPMEIDAVSGLVQVDYCSINDGEAKVAQVDNIVSESHSSSIVQVDPVYNNGPQASDVVQVVNSLHNTLSCDVDQVDSSVNKSNSSSLVQVDNSLYNTCPQACDVVQVVNNLYNTLSCDVDQVDSSVNESNSSSVVQVENSIYNQTNADVVQVDNSIYNTLTCDVV